MSTENKLAEVERAIREGVPCVYCDNGMIVVGVDHQWTEWDSRQELVITKRPCPRVATFHRLKPVISRLLDAAHTDALRAAAKIAEDQVSSFAETLRNTEGSEGSTNILKAHMAEAAGIAHYIDLLIPERARLERELEVARAVANDVQQLAVFMDNGEGEKAEVLLEACHNKVADLEAKLAALEGKSENKT